MIFWFFFSLTATLCLQLGVSCPLPTVWFITLHVCGFPFSELNNSCLHYSITAHFLAITPPDKECCYFGHSPCAVPHVTDRPYRQVLHFTYEQVSGKPPQTHLQDSGLKNLGHDNFHSKKSLQILLLYFPWTTMVLPISWCPCWVHSAWRGLFPASFFSLPTLSAPAPQQRGQAARNQRLVTY